ncbi:MAG: hypothetical protein ACON5D_18105 [Rubripirellula sp.]
MSIWRWQKPTYSPRTLSDTYLPKLEATWVYLTLPVIGKMGRKAYRVLAAKWVPTQSHAS